MNVTPSSVCSCNGSPHFRWIHFHDRMIDSNELITQTDNRSTVKIPAEECEWWETVYWITAWSSNCLSSIQLWNESDFFRRPRGERRLWFQHFLTFLLGGGRTASLGDWPITASPTASGAALLKGPVPRCSPWMLGPRLRSQHHFPSLSNSCFSLSSFLKHAGVHDSVNGAFGASLDRLMIQLTFYLHV